MSEIGKPCNSSYHRLKWVTKPISQTLFWLYTFALAAFASVYSKEIKEFVFPWHEAADAPNWYTISIFLLALLAALFFSVSVWVRAIRSDYLLRAIQTSPPSSFWRQYEDAFSRAWNLKALAEAALSEGQIEEGKKSVRILLDHVINLVQEWDSANLERRVVYRANLMKVIYFEDDPDYEITDDNRYFMVPARDHYSGVVTLEGADYTTTTETDESEPDPDRKPITFPFCLQGNRVNVDFQSNLRGAPYSIATCSYDYVGDVMHIVDAYEESSPRTDRILDNLREYYSKPDNPAHSILSIPLIGPKLDAEEGATLKVSWVLNIYRNQAEMLYNGIKAKDFVSVVTPFTAILLDTLNLIDYYASRLDEEEA